MFFEQFTGKLGDRWKPSHAVKADTDGEFSYVGKWAIEEAKVFPGFKGDKGLVAKSEASHHAISAKLDEPLDNKGKTLVVQYEVKLQDGLECGGAYIKLLSNNDKLHSEEFSNDTPYQVMFGPDKCGTTNKVHMIIKRKNPKTGEYEEKHLRNPPVARLNKSTNIYTLILKETQDFEVRINGKTVRAGSLLDENTIFPSINPPKLVDDLDEEKPDDWVEDTTIPDPDHPSKPSDWDETEPARIPDPDAEMPDDWDEDASEFIPDPDAEIPDDWDEEEDGEFVAPEIPNPECEEHGCGPWEPPSIPNPNYKGKWVQPTIPNPDYKGPWKPRQIPNPDYYEDASPADLEPIGAIGIEIWTMQKNILFDNFYIGHSIEVAEEIGNATFVPKFQIENAQEDKEILKNNKKKDRKLFDTKWEHFKGDPADFFVELARSFILNMYIDPAVYIKNQPATFIGVVTGLLVILGLSGTILYSVFSYILSFLFGSSSTKSAPSKEDIKIIKAKKGTTEKDVISAKEIVELAKSTATESKSTPIKRTPVVE